MELLSKKGAKLMDKGTIEDIGIPSIVLMENAAEGICKEIILKGEKYIIFCGEGNNGGDGLALARKLFIAKKNVKVFIVGDEKGKSEEFKVNYNIIKKLGVYVKKIDSNYEKDEKFIKELSQADVVVDAIFGVGLSRTVENLFNKVIKWINTYSRNTISIDIPSGLDCDSGRVMGIAVKAKETYTIEVLKKGFLSYGAREFLGKVKVIKIGIPVEIKRRYTEKNYIFSERQYKDLVPIRKKWGHKGDYGKVLILAGSSGLTGAAYITTESTIRTGAGLVTLLINKDSQDILSSKLTEAMTVNYTEMDRIKRLVENCDVIACGPGLGQDEDAVEMLNFCIKNSTCPIVVDADALNIIADEQKLLTELKGRGIFTPHPGEMARLIGCTINEIEENRINISKKYAKDNDIILVLKGYNSIITDGDQAVINTTGSSKMASGGMGDCLTGVITALIAQKVVAFEAATLGCYIHGLAGDRAGAARYNVNARDVIEEIPKTIEELILN